MRQEAEQRGKVMSLRQAAQQAILLCEWIDKTPHERGSINGMAAQVKHTLEQALAEPEPKPVAWMCPDDPDRATAFAWRYGYCIDCGKPRIPVYTAPKGATK